MDEDDKLNGRQGGGDSGGGAYPNPHSGKAPGKDGFLAAAARPKRPITDMASSAKKGRATIPTHRRKTERHAGLDPASMNTSEGG